MPAFAPPLPSSDHKTGRPEYEQVHGIGSIVAPVLNGARRINLKGLSTKQVQKLLMARGYKIGGVDGKMGPRTKTAIDAYIHGKPPRQYNAWATRHFGQGIPGVNRVIAGAKALTGGAPASGVKGKSGGGGKGGGGGSKSGSGLVFDPNSIGEMLPEEAAGQVAGLQFDPQIHETQRALDLLPVQGAQNLHDISHWYGQVLDSVGKAAQRDSEINQAGQGSVKDAVQGIIASLGGGANQGAGVVGGAGVDALGMLAATGAAQDQYNQDIQPLLQSESAGASTRERARQSQQDRDLRGTLTDLLGQKGAARAAALLDIKDKNNALSQTRFQDALALEQTRQAALLTGAKIASLGQSVGGKVTPNTLGKASNGAMNQFAVTDESGNVVGYRPPKGMSVQQIVQKVNNAYLGLGLNLKNPQVAQSAMATLRALGIQADPRWYGQG